MGIFGFFGEVANAAVKVVVTPLAMIKDVTEFGEGENTKKLIESIGDDIEKGFDKLTGEL